MISFPAKTAAVPPSYVSLPTQKLRPLRDITSICVFCGSSTGSEKIYSDKARQLARLMAANHIALVYGGSNVGIMRILADTMMNEGGKVIGVMPHNLIEREVAHTSITEFRIVGSMAERKTLMGELSDAFISMPGGIGTLDELFEVMSWNQLELMDKPVALFNVGNYYDHLVSFLQKAVDHRFIKSEHLLNLIVDEDENQLLQKIKNYEAVKVEGGKWIHELKADTLKMNGNLS
jgi:uncharacterized protein (TIGR00730 family)